MYGAYLRHSCAFIVTFLVVEQKVSSTFIFKRNVYMPLLSCEESINNAPIIKLSNGEQCIPQHYFRYKHTLNSVQEIVCDINYCPRYPVFVCQQGDNIYIKIGIVGRDNYAKNTLIPQQKIVYGRKWRIEPELPTSEIIQTIFLAIKKAREHEIRELFRLSTNGKLSTPFNNHHDLPLMAKHSTLLQIEPSEGDIANYQILLQGLLNLVRYDNAALAFKNIEQRNNGQWLIDIKIVPSQLTTLPELEDIEITLLISVLSVNEIYLNLMDEFIGLSDQHINENFSYKGFKRFSKAVSIVGLAKLLSQTRGESEDVIAFESCFKMHNDEIDKTRVPTLDESVLSNKIKSSLIKFGELTGIVPIEAL